MIDRKAFAQAVQERDENKLYRYFKSICNLCGYTRHKDYDDWAQESIWRAFRYLDKYDTDRGEAFSYFYRIISIHFAYLYRNSLQRKNLNPEYTITLEETIPYEQEFWGEEKLVSIAGHILSESQVEEMHDKFRHCKQRKYKIKLLRLHYKLNNYNIRTRKNAKRKYRHEALLQEPVVEELCKEDAGTK